MPLSDSQKIKILEVFLVASDYHELAWLLFEGPEDQLEVDTVRAAYISKNDMLNKINEYAQTPEGRDKVIEIFGQGDHSIIVNNKITENVNTFWANTGIVALGRKRLRGKKSKKSKKSKKGKRSRKRRY